MSIWKRDFEARRISPPQNMDPPVVQAAQAILRGEDGIERVHIESSLEKINDELAALANDLKGEARLRCLMSQRAILDCAEEFERNG